MSDGSSCTGESVIRMANQIARNFAVHGADTARDETAEHIRLFWDPRMRARAFELLAEPDCGFSQAARAALMKLAEEADA